MSPKNLYELLGVEPTVSIDEIKRAFRQQIARYHPDKVQHLGEEFQALATTRAADLTEAYRILTDEALREQYDRSREASPAAASPAPRPATTESAPAAEEPEATPPRSGAEKSAQFRDERASRDALMRKAALGRFRQAIASMSADYDESPVRGFDLAWVPKAKMFSRTKRPRLLVRVVPTVDAAAVTDAWTSAGKWNVPVQEDLCVFLVGASIAPARELADAIHALRRKAGRAAKVTLIPVDMRDWDAHVPIDAPETARVLVARIRQAV